MSSNSNSEVIPYSDPYFHSNPSPYWKEHHFTLAKKVRNFIDKEISPNALKWDENKSYPLNLHKKAYNAGVYSVNFDKKLGSNQPNKYDYFSFFIFHDEIARCAAGGLGNSTKHLKIFFTVFRNSFFYFFIFF